MLGRDVRYQEIPDDLWRDGALAGGVNQHAVEHLSQLWRSLRTPEQRPARARLEITDTIEKLGGGRPKAFETFVREERDALLAESGTVA